MKKQCQVSDLILLCKQADTKQSRLLSHELREVLVFVILGSLAALCVKGSFQGKCDHVAMAGPTNLLVESGGRIL